MTLPYSGAIFIQAFPRECTETGTAKLYAITRRDRGLNLQIDLQVPRLGCSDQIVHDVAIAEGEVRRLGRLVAKTSIKLDSGHEAGRGADK